MNKLQLMHDAIKTESQRKLSKKCRNNHSSTNSGGVYSSMSKLPLMPRVRSVLEGGGGGGKEA